MPETESWTLLDLDVVRCTDGNLTVDHPRRGNTRNYTLERLKRDRPDLFERVKSRKLTDR